MIVLSDLTVWDLRSDPQVLIGRPFYGKEGVYTIRKIEGDSCECHNSNTGETYRTNLSLLYQDQAIR